MSSKSLGTGNKHIEYVDAFRPNRLLQTRWPPVELAQLRPLTNAHNGHCQGRGVRKYGRVCREEREGIMEKDISWCYLA